MEPTNIFQVVVKGFQYVEYLELMPDKLTMSFKDQSQKQIFDVLLEDVLGVDEHDGDTVKVHFFSKQRELDQAGDNRRCMCC